MHKNRKKGILPKRDIELDIPTVIFKIYLIPLAKISLFLWLIISGRVIAGCTIYILFGFFKLRFFKKSGNSNIDNWIVIITSCVLLWPAIDVFTFFPPKRY